MKYKSGLETRDTPADGLPVDPIFARQEARLDRLRAFMQERKDSGPLSAAKQEKCLALLVRFILSDASDEGAL